MALAKHSGKKGSEYEQLIGAAGFRQPTLLQQLVLPPVLEGRDVDAETGIHPGKTLAIAVALILKTGKARSGIKSIVLTKDREQAQKIVRILSQTLAAFGRGAVSAVIGFSDLIKKEARQLEERPDILVSTPSRLIDHIRRANVDLGAVERVFIDEAEAFEQEFESDICFILSKIKESVQLVRFAYARENAYQNFEQLLKRPVVIREKDFASDNAEITYSYMVGENKEDLLLRAVMSLTLDCAAIILDSSPLAKKVAAQLSAVRFRGLAVQKDARAIDLAGREKLDFVILPRELLGRISLEGVSHIINCEPGFWEGDCRKHLALTQSGRAVIHCLTLATPPEAEQLEAVKERERIKMEKQNPPVNEDIIKGTISRLLSGAAQGGGTEDMKQYLAAVKRGVPLGKRALFIASLLKDMVHPVIAGKVEFVTLFLGVGRSRDVSPRDIAALFIDTLAMDKSRLGDIRIFDNYSFVEIDGEYADKAIAALSQKELKGRKLIINYSRKKEEKRRFSGGPRRHKRD